MSYSPNEWYLDVMLVALNGPFKDNVYGITESNCFTFGNAPECSLTIIEDKTLLPVHFQVVLQQPVVWLISSGGVFTYDYLMQWRYYITPDAESFSIENVCHLALPIAGDDYIRVGDYFFQLKVEMVHVCIECGKAMNAKKSNLFDIVTNIPYCPDCKILEAMLLEKAGRYEESIEYCTERYSHKLADLNYLARRAREIWLNGIHNNKDYVKIHLDAKAILDGID